MVGKKFINSGNVVRINNFSKGEITDKLNPLIYTVKYDDKMGFYLKISKERFELPERIYGDVYDRIKKIEKLYANESSSMGVNLTGLKGTSKSTLSKVLAHRMLDKGKAVVLVQDTFAGSDFMEFLDSLGEVIIIFDEFAKNYKMHGTDGNQQEQLLTLFDGVYSSKRLIVMSDNNIQDISDLYKNRPSRVLLHWHYKRLDIKLIEDYCKDNLKSKSYKDDIISIYNISPEFNFDSLKALVKTCNIFDGEPFSYIIDGLNIQQDKTYKYAVISMINTTSGVEYIDLELVIGDEDEFDIRISGAYPKTKEKNGDIFSRSDRKFTEYFTKREFVSQNEDILTFKRHDKLLKIKDMEFNKNAPGK